VGRYYIGHRLHELSIWTSDAWEAIPEPVRPADAVRMTGGAYSTLRPIAADGRLSDREIDAATDAIVKAGYAGDRNRHRELTLALRDALSGCGVARFRALLRDVAKGA
jgi:hypothetical protein